MFVLGVGAQKAGTTWLAENLSRSSFPARKDRYKKEWHYRDREFHTARKRPVGTEREISAAFRRAPLLAAIKNHDKYFNKVISLTQSETGEAGLAFDITPSYSGLPAVALKEILVGFKRHSIDFRVIFLMRDPVDRIYSAVKMNRNLLAKKGRNQNKELTYCDGGLDENAKEYATTWAALSRTRYELILANLFRVFDRRQLLIEINESLSSRETINRLAGFLNLEEKSFLPQRVFASRSVTQPRADVAAQIVSTYRPTYEWCESQFPEVRSLWPGFKYLDG